MGHNQTKPGKELLSLRNLLTIFTFMVILSSGIASAQLEERVISPPSVDARTTSTVAQVLFADRDEDLHVVWVETTDTGSDVYYYRFKNATGKWAEGVALTEGAQAENCDDGCAIDGKK